MATESSEMPSDYGAALSSGVYGGYKKSGNPSFGSWRSPIESASIANSGISIKYLNLSESRLYWIESRPTEKGRNVITTLSDQDEEKKDDNNINKKDITPKELNSASGVHEYGGNPYIILLKNNKYITCNWNDGRLYIIDGDDYKAITNEYSSGQWRYVDMNQNPIKTNHIYAVREEHMKDDKPNDVINCLVVINMDNSEQIIVAAGNTFYSYPRCDPTGCYLAYITWNFPSMPWDHTMLCLAKLNSINGEISSQQIIDCGSSIMHPKWSMDGKDLYYITDERNYWEIWRYNLQSKQARPILIDCIKMEFGFPCWNIGKQRFDLIDDDTIYAAAIQNGTSKLIKIGNIRDKTVESKAEIIDLDTRQISYIDELYCDTDKKKIYLLGGGPLRPMSIFEYDIKDDNDKDIVPKILVHCRTTVDRKYISIPESIEFKTSKNQIAYAYIYKPKNDDITMKEDDIKTGSPLLVLSHGGPTSACNTVYNEEILFFTSRGFTVANVNYRGSTGYGTIYRKLLELKWGIYDKEDCCAVAEYLKSANLVNPSQCVIRGGSAGGYTTLCCLTMDTHCTFNAGCSRYGVADIALLMRDTHKFESEYLYPLLGYDNKIYSERSPINFVDKLKCPVLFLHGELDRVVPLNQAQCMFDAMKKNNITTGFEIFKDEYHGFKKAESKIAAIDYEYRFYSEILGFPLSKQDDVNMKKPKLVYGDGDKQ